MKLTRFSLAAVVLGASCVGLLGSCNRQATGVPPPGSRMLMQSLWVTQNGQKWLRESVIRHERPDGAWRFFRKTLKPTGGVESDDSGVALPGRGVFAVNPDKTLTMISLYEEPIRLTAAQLRAAPQYVEERSILGHPVAVMRQESEAGSIETYFAFDMDGSILRQIIQSEDLSSVLDTVYIGPSTLSEGEISGLLSRPIKYDHMERKAARLEIDSPAAAQQLRQQIERCKAAR